MKSFKEFKELLVDKFEGFNVTFDRVEKVNYSYNGITICKTGERFGATVDVDELYQNYLCDEDVIDDFYDLINKRLGSSDEVDALRAFVNDSSVLYDVSNYRVRVCSVAGREHYLEDKIWRPYLDLAIVVYATVFVDNDDSFGSVVITKSAAEKTGLSADEIIDTAIKNSLCNEPPFYSCLFDVIKEAAPDDMELDDMEPDDVSNSLYVVTNQKKNLGAYAILDTEGALKSITKILGNEYYILPSSIHELLCVQKVDDEGQERALLNMVNSVNSDCLSEAEFLSNNIYKYNNGVVELVNVEVC